MASPYDPRTVKCLDWRKIDPRYSLSQLPPATHCLVCDHPDALRCAGCFRTVYCGADHQRKHWIAGHKDDCSPFRIVRGDDKSVGRIVVAARDINPGEVIMEEQPVTVGPRQFTDPVCLGCYVAVDGSYTCSGCQWPLCSKECETNPVHTLECHILGQCKLKPSRSDSHIYECLTPLRCLLIKDASPQNYRVMMAMERHTELRKLEEVYPVNQTNTVGFVRRCVMPDASAEEVNAAVDLLDVNAFEIRGEGFSVRGVYPLTAMMNAVCCPNTQNCIGEDYTCRVRAARGIRGVREHSLLKKGEEVTTTYTLTLSGTLYRRRHLQETKYFGCACQRCEDPTELGSHFSTLLCQEVECRGLVTPKDPLDEASDWQCDACLTTKGHQEVADLIRKIETEVENLPVEKRAVESRLETLRPILHPNHYLSLDLRITLVQLYGRERLHEDEMLSEARAKRELCLQILGVLDKITPGRFRTRGMLLFELAVVSLFLLKKEGKKTSSMDKDQFGGRMSEVRGHLEESREILSWEPEKSLEGTKCRSAGNLLKKLEGVDDVWKLMKST